MLVDGIDRPAIAANWPKFRSTKSAIVLDLGADVRASARNLVQYAIMGSEFCRIMMNLDEKPKVALLNVGTEETKGLQHIRDASQQLKTIANKPNARFEYISFIEGSDIMTSPADVVVTDGFSGNIALKTAEGSVRFAFSVIQDTLASRSFLCKLAGWAFFPALKEAKRIIDPRGRNGGIFLGLNGAVVKSHGAADAVGVENALNLSAIVARNNLTARISEQITLLTLETDVNI
jgi:glycerol-3-phosphate acyltransferase PlsX